MGYAKKLTGFTVITVKPVLLVMIYYLNCISIYPHKNTRVDNIQIR